MFISITAIIVLIVFLLLLNKAQNNASAVLRDHEKRIRSLEEAQENIDDQDDSIDEEWTGSL